MRETILKKDNYQKRKKIVLSSILILIGFLFLWGFNTVNAYYNSKTDFSFLGTTIGDFDIGDGDINLVLYKESDDGKYNLTKSIPLIGYYLNNDKTDCSNKNTVISYENATNEVNIETDSQTTCRIYFDQLGESDVRAYMLVETTNGEYSYNGKTYNLSNKVPDVGYEYLTYACQNPEAVTEIDYDGQTRTFTYKSTDRNICYIYFNALSNPDVTLNIYIQETMGSESYMNVTNIPTLYTYKLNSTKSYCLDLDNNNIGSAVLSYADRKISVEVEYAGVCYVYLDINN